jgi:hypothetical protein
MSHRGFWTCQRRSLGVKCGHRNPNRKRNCAWCKKPRPARKRPAHMSALALPYDYYVQLNGSETLRHLRSCPEAREEAAP